MTAASGHPLLVKGHPPTNDVLSAFGLDGTPEKIEGGQGNCYRVGDAVLKPVASHETDEVEWIAAIQGSIKQDGFRLPRQLRTRTSGLLYRHWTAWELVEGAPSRERWEEVFLACDAFHRALQGIAKPAFMETRGNKWAVADKMVWGDLPLEYDEPLGIWVEPLVSMARLVALPEQVIHGDFGSGNVLFANDGGAPYVIDFSPYYRPAGFAKAVIAVDAMAWGRADEGVLQYMKDEPEARQLIARAAMRRILEEGAAGSAYTYGHVIDYLARTEVTRKHGNEG